MARAFVGTLMHTPVLGQVEVLREHLIVVDADGTITHLGPAAGAAATAALSAVGLGEADVRHLTRLQFLLPGFIDTHAHAPQYTFTGVGTDLPLFEWLRRYTFPCEAAFEDVAHARRVYARVVRRLLRLGTTTANYFTTLHVDACKELAAVVVECGQRAVLGKVCMDINSPEGYQDASAAESIEGARQVVQHIRGLDCDRLVAAVVPRFIPTCSLELLEGLGRLAAELPGLVVHSHLSESLDQVAATRALHPDQPHDAAVYDAAGLLGARSIFAHATQICPDGLQLMAARGAAVSHCPLSNFFFGDGLLDVSAALAAGVKVGLGTDIAGGYSPSMLQAMRAAVISSHALKAAALMAGATAGQQPEQPPEPQQLVNEAAAAPAGSRAGAAISNPAVSAAASRHMLTWEDALWLATAGGAAALGLADTVGVFGVGMSFDALLCDVGVNDVFELFEAEPEPLRLLELFLTNGDDRNILATIVAGRDCKPE